VCCPWRNCPTEATDQWGYGILESAQLDVKVRPNTNDPKGIGTMVSGRCVHRGVPPANQRAGLMLGAPRLTKS
jgi:hypothetical protein